MFNARLPRLHLSEGVAKRTELLAKLPVKELLHVISVSSGYVGFGT
jgi:hypothetical protein